MHLDVRVPAGMMFAIMGSVLTAFGVATRNRADIYTRSMGIDANLWWGLVLLIFGMIVLSLGRKGQGVIERERGKTGNRD
jgi:multisubunit Na+/H+ antiporter MnhG subunit